MATQKQRRRLNREGAEIGPQRTARAGPSVKNLRVVQGMLRKASNRARRLWLRRGCPTIGRTETVSVQERGANRDYALRAVRQAGIAMHVREVLLLLPVSAQYPSGSGRNVLLSRL